MRIKLLPVLVLFGSVSVLAQSAAISPSRRGAQQGSSPNTPSDRMSAESKKVYEKLFDLDKDRGEKLAETEKAARIQLTSKPPGSDAPKRKIVCGLTVWNVGPELDPRMVRRAPSNDRVDFKIEKIAPTVCAE
jgi:hypothetical protein